MLDIRGPDGRAPFDRYLAQWNLVPDGQPVGTRSSWLLAVRRAGEPAMLKIAHEDEERRGGSLMVWWGGEGAARVLEHDGAALLLERAVGDASLAAMVRSGRDDETSRILCAAVAPLHARRDRLPPGVLLGLPEWFSALEPSAARFGGVLRESAAAASALLADPRDIGVLHGDLHHGNVLDFGHRGWLAIDPKGLIGERGFDFANIFCNPDFVSATEPGRLARQAGVIAAAAGLERERLLRWVLAYAGLSAAWTLGDGDDATLALAVARLAAAELAATAETSNVAS